MKRLYNIAGNAIYLYDDIRSGITGNKLLETLTQASDMADIELHINSDGGDVFEGIAVYNMLKPRNVRVFIDGICASAASIIAMCGHLTMPDNTMMMIHNPMGVVYGTSEEMKDEAAILDKIRDLLVKIYAAKTGLDSAKIEELMKKETWMSASEAKALGFADEVIGAIPKESEKTYEDGVKEERERIKALDALMYTGREDIIYKAKYRTIQSARDVAIDILNMEKNKPTPVAIYTSDRADPDTAIEMITTIINGMRGYRNGR